MRAAAQYTELPSTGCNEEIVAEASEANKPILVTNETYMGVCILEEASIQHTGH